MINEPIRIDIMTQTKLKDPFKTSIFVKAMFFNLFCIIFYNLIIPNKQANNLKIYTLVKVRCHLCNKVKISIQ